MLPFPAAPFPAVKVLSRDDAAAFRTIGESLRERLPARSPRQSRRRSSRHPPPTSLSSPRRRAPASRRRQQPAAERAAGTDPVAVTDPSC